MSANSARLGQNKPPHQTKHLLIPLVDLDMGVPELLLNFIPEREFKVIQEKTFAARAIPRNISIALRVLRKSSAPHNIFVQVIVDQVFGS